MDDLESPINAARLTELLRNAGVLDVGEVTHVEIASSQDNLLSRTCRLLLTYARGGHAAPGSLFLKTVSHERKANTRTEGPREIAFYQKVALAKPTDVVPRCYDAHWDAQSQDWHLLLEDLSQSHALATEWPLPPSAAQSRRMVRALACFHATWWEDDRLGVTIGVRPDAKYAEQKASWLERYFGQFASDVGDLLSASRRALFEKFIQAAARLFAHDGRSPVTIAHGDAHTWNCLLPHDNTEGAVKWLDWDAWQVNIGMADIAYMITPHWYPEHRQRFESEMLDTYHEALLKHGVANYDGRALREDYRIAVLCLLARSLWQRADKLPPIAWWDKLEHVFLAIEDLRYEEVLDALR